MPAKVYSKLATFVTAMPKLKQETVSLKEKVQDMIMHNVTNTSYYIEDLNVSDKEKQALHRELKKQINRLEKFFGYEVDSWK